MTLESSITEPGLFDYELQERASILEFDAGMNRSEAEKVAIEQERHRHECEVRDLVNRYYPKRHSDMRKAGKRMEAALLEIEKKRGKEAADKLRADCREEWKRRRDELAGQA